MVKTESPVRRNFTWLLGTVAVVLAVAASLFLALWPTYRGETVSAGSGGQEQVVRTTATLIEINGYRVISLLVLPIVLTVAGLLSIRMMDYRSLWGKIAIWAPTIILWVFVAAGSFSIGLLYLPAAVVLLVSAILFSRRQSIAPGPPKEERAG